MIFENASVKNKTLVLVAGAMMLFAIAVGLLFIYNQRQTLHMIKQEDQHFAQFAYQEIFKRQQIADRATLNAFLQTPGFAEAFVKRDRNEVIRLWDEHWNRIKNENISILQLHEANGFSFLRMHKKDHYGDKISLKRPMIAYVHETHQPISGFEIGIYGLAYRVAVPIIINGKYEGALEIGSDPKRLIEEIYNSIGISGILLIPNDPLLKQGLYKERIGDYWRTSDTGITPEIYHQFSHAHFQNGHLQFSDWLNRYAVTSVNLLDYRNREVAHVAFIRDNTDQTYSIYLRAFVYGFVALFLVATLLIFVNRWFGVLIGQLENSHRSLTTALQELDRYKTVLDSHNIVSKSDLKGIITYVNDNFCKISGYTKEELVGHSHNIIRHPDMPSDMFKELWETIKKKEIWSGIIKNRKKDGSDYYIDAMIVPFCNENQEITEYIAVRHDITELMERRKELEHLAKTDLLTQMGNRLKLISDLSAAHHPALAIMDIDRFSQINDFYGHIIGDQVIFEFAKKTRELIPAKIGIYRLGSDVLALMGDECDRDEFIAMCEGLSQNIRATPLNIDQKVVPLEVTIGISFEPSENILSTCDMALSVAKKQKTPLNIYSQEFSPQKEYEYNILWTLKIKKAIEENRIITYYQPIIDNKTGTITKYESLVRLVEEDGNIVSPFFFLDIAKKSKQYPEITKRVIKQAFEKFASLDLSFSFNITIEDILSEEFNAFFNDMLNVYELLQGRIVIELVESEGIESFDQVSAFISEAKKNGCSIAIDDFGTGYSNFEYLLRLQPDYIKIDGSMIKHVNSDPHALEIIKTIVDFAKRTGIKTIAEYVCDEAVYLTIRELGIDYSQGYYFGEPKGELIG